MKKIKIMSVFGTRPEAIKMAPVVKALEKDSNFESFVCVTAQHREMLDQVLDLFEIKPDYDLNIMKSGQTLSEITARVLTKLEAVLKEVQPDMVLVHGDTSTTFTSALCAFYNRVKVGHVEAGLRSFDLYSPFPEEGNRLLVGRLTNLHFSPTESNVQNLLAEGISEDIIVKTGNTVIDALKYAIEDDYVFDEALLNELDYENRKVIILTSHRSENIGQPMENIFSATRRLADDYEDIDIVFPMHLNPKVRNIAYKHLENHERIHLIEPLEYKPFANLMSRAYLVLTDSGGIQEEAPALGSPALVLRTETERPEAVEAGTVKMAGVEEDMIYSLASRLISDSEAYGKMANAVNPYGDGHASERILKAIKTYFE